MCGVLSFMMCEKCVYGRIGHTNIHRIWPAEEPSISKLGDNRSEAFLEIKFHLNGMSI